MNNLEYQLNNSLRVQLIKAYKKLIPWYKRIFSRPEIYFMFQKEGYKVQECYLDHNGNIHTRGDICLDWCEIAPYRYDLLGTWLLNDWYKS